MIEININGQSVEAKEGSTIIEAADKVGIYIPRFCYHHKLTVVANCRMCLVEVEGARKPMPACATPITAGMKVFTQSKAALAAQKAVMEFLLVNHPLDCPVCDQGGQCELQDLSMGFGNDHSRFAETKRAVVDPDLGSLVSTHMTRCIQCTRCVRFGDEIAGVREIGAVGRGEDMAITTYVKHFLKSEVSGNIIDICPVGALTNKPAKFSARSWEMQEHPMVAPHDCVGTNMYVHTKWQQYAPQREVIRFVPRENEAINEVWMSDRDRYSFQGLYQDRILKPMKKHGEKWVSESWERLLTEAADKLRGICQLQSPDEICAIVSPNSTVEEAYLTQKIVRALGSDNVDHRLRMSDDQLTAGIKTFPGMPFSIPSISDAKAILLIGSNIREEQPLLSLRVRKAWQHGAQVMSIANKNYLNRFELSDKAIVAPQHMRDTLLQLAKAVNASLPGDLLSGIEVSDTAKSMAAKLQAEGEAKILCGADIINHPQASQLMLIVQAISAAANAPFAMLTEGANSAGAWMAGAVPQRGGATAVQSLTTKPKRAYILVNVEPEFDCAYAAKAIKQLDDAGLVICLTPYKTTAMEQYADFILPIAPFTESGGTYVNVTGEWQSVAPASVPEEGCQPAWKVLRALASFIELEGFDYKTREEVLDEVKTSAQTLVPDMQFELTNAASMDGDVIALPYTHMYRTDNLVRRAQALQETILPEQQAVQVHSQTAGRLGLKNGDMVNVSAPEHSAEFLLMVSDDVPLNTAIVPVAMSNAAPFNPAFCAVTLSRGN